MKELLIKIKNLKNKTEKPKKNCCEKTIYGIKNQVKQRKTGRVILDEERRKQRSNQMKQ